MQASRRNRKRQSPSISFISTDENGTIGSMGDRNPSQIVKQIAKTQGFERCGIARAGPVDRADYFRTWLNSGRAGSMKYIGRHADVRLDPRELLDGAKSIVVLALSYKQPPAPPSIDRGAHGRVAMYAWGDDYHKVVKKKLFAMADRMSEVIEEPFETRACVDTAPLLEREWAAAAGVGWIGRNTLVMDHQLGSYFFLGALVTTLELDPDRPAVDHCGTCRACLDACPTEAFPKPYEMDASRCISYLTIEHRGDIPESLQSKMGDWVFGCDECQAVCPHNSDASMTREARFTVKPPAPRIPLDAIKNWSIEVYAEHLRGSAMKRATLAMLQRNAGIVNRNQRRARTELDAGAARATPPPCQGGVGGE